MKYMVLVGLMVGLIACSDTKKSDGEQPIGASTPLVQVSKNGRGPLSEAEKGALRDCGHGTLLDNDAEVTKINGQCKNQSFLHVILSKKYSNIHDSILFNDALWVVMEKKDGDIGYFRIAGGLENIGKLGEIDDLDLILLDNQRMNHGSRLVVEDGKLFLVGKGWLPLSESGPGELVEGFSGSGRLFHAKGQLWTNKSGSTVPARVGPGQSSRAMAGSGFFKELNYYDAHGSGDLMFMSVRRKDTKQAQLAEVNVENISIVRTIDVPYVLDHIVVAHGFVWGVSEEERMLIRVPVGGGKVEKVMSLSKKSSEDPFTAHLASDDASIWLSFKGFGFDRGVIRFSPDGKPTGFIDSIYVNVLAFSPL